MKDVDVGNFTDDKNTFVCDHNLDKVLNSFEENAEI